MSSESGSTGSQSPTPTAMASSGKAARRRVSRASHAEWTPPDDRSDPLEILEAQNRTRLPDLIPVRMGRMSESPFAFLRGSAAVMAADLATTPTTGIEVQSCGDAHLLNFGLFASPERTLLFDVVDFDETGPAPFEWDLKRLAVSSAVAARDNHLSDEAARKAACSATASYRKATAEFARLNSLDVFYARVDKERAESLVKAWPRRQEQEVLANARRRTATRALAKLTVIDENGLPRIVEQPPLVVRLPITDDAPGVRGLIESYRRSLRANVRNLLSRFHVVDVARKVVGVGSVGTRCYVVLLLDESGSPLFLQIKQAEASILEKYWPPTERLEAGRRVVEGQQVMQAASDIFLGWGADLGGKDFYVRQLWDMKSSIDVNQLTAPALIDCAVLCGWTLARAHAQSGKAAEIAGYLGSTTTFDEAVADFAMLYAVQVEQDHAKLLAAIEGGQVEVQLGL